MCCCHQSWDLLQQILSSPLPLLCLSLADRHFPSHTSLPVAPAGTGRYLARYWSWCLSEREELFLLIGQQVAVPADQEAVLSAEVKGSGILYVIARVHVQYALTSSSGEELVWVWGLQPAAATGMTWKQKHSIQHGHDSALIACSQCENTKLLQLNLSPDRSMRALPGWRTGVGTWL